MPVRNALAELISLARVRPPKKNADALYAHLRRLQEVAQSIPPDAMDQAAVALANARVDATTQKTLLDMFNLEQAEKTAPANAALVGARASAADIKNKLSAFQLAQLEKTAAGETAKAAADDVLRREAAVYGGTAEQKLQEMLSQAESMGGTGRAVPRTVQKRIAALREALTGLRGQVADTGPAAEGRAALMKELDALGGGLRSDAAAVATRAARLGKIASAEKAIGPKIAEFLGAKGAKSLGQVGGAMLKTWLPLLLLPMLIGKIGGEYAEGVQYEQMNPPRSAADVLADLQTEDIQRRRAAAMLQSPEMQAAMQPDLSRAQTPLGPPDIMAMLSGQASRRPI